MTERYNRKYPFTENTSGQVGYAAVKGDVRPADNVAAPDRMAKVLGLYRDDRADRDQRPVRVTNVNVVLNHADQGRGQ